MEERGWGGCKGVEWERKREEGKERNDDCRSRTSGVEWSGVDQMEQSGQRSTVNTRHSPIQEHLPADAETLGLPSGGLRD